MCSLWLYVGLQVNYWILPTRHKKRCIHVWEMTAVSSTNSSKDKVDLDPRNPIRLCRRILQALNRRAQTGTDAVGSGFRRPIKRLFSINNLKKIKGAFHVKSIDHFRVTYRKLRK